MVVYQQPLWLEASERYRIGGMRVSEASVIVEAKQI